MASIQLSQKRSATPQLPRIGQQELSSSYPWKSRKGPKRLAYRTNPKSRCHWKKIEADEESEEGKSKLKRMKSQKKGKVN
jgi:hypothetical protein